MLSVLETLTRDDEARYWSKVAKPYNEITECWMWTGRSIGVIATCATCHDEWTDVVVHLHQSQTLLKLERQA